MHWTPGSTVSAVGHSALVVWLIAGWGFRSEPLPFEVSEVSIVTSEEYAALVSATTPDPGDTAPDAPVAPLVDTAPETPLEDAVANPVEPPAPPAPPPPDAPPPDAPPPDTPEPLPVPPSDTPPELGPPQQEVVAAPNIQDSPNVIPRPSTRVAPEAVAPPPPDATPDPVVREESTPDAPPDATVVEEESPEQTAPEEAATQIVTEAETPSGRVTETPRPPARPDRPAPAPVPEPAPAPEPEPQVAEDPAPTVDEDAIAAALAAAAAVEAPQADLAPGPPLTGSEQEGFRVAVNACWNVDPGSQAARVTMTVSFSMDRDGRVQGDVRQVGAMGGDAGATEIAYQAARRAILRCQGQGGYDLPVEKYDQWREVEITFDPSGMRLR